MHALDIGRPARCAARMSRDLVFGLAARAAPASAISRDRRQLSWHPRGNPWAGSRLARISTNRTVRGRGARLSRDDCWRVRGTRHRSASTYGLPNHATRALKSGCSRSYPPGFSSRRRRGGRHTLRSFAQQSHSPRSPMSLRSPPVQLLQEQAGADRDQGLGIRVPDELESLVYGREAAEPVERLDVVGVSFDPSCQELHRQHEPR
jgi:hypothetical protein